MLGSRARCHVVRVGMYELSDGVIGDGTNLVCITELDTMKCRVFFLVAQRVFQGFGTTFWDVSCVMRPLSQLHCSFKF